MSSTSIQRIAQALFAAAFVLSAHQAPHAQAVHGSLYGTVTDPSGAIVPGATVTVTDQQKGTVQTTTTNATGNWTVDHNAEPKRDGGLRLCREAVGVDPSARRLLSYHVSESKYGGLASATTLGLPNLNTTPETAGAPSFSFNQGTISSLGNQGCNCPLYAERAGLSVDEQLDEDHSIRTGADLRCAKNVRNASDSNRSGQFVFDNAATGISNAGGVVSTGSDLASYLVGDAARFQRFDVYINDQYSYQKRGAFYLQDTWRATPKSTLNYGARWDVIFPQTVNGLGHGGFASLETGGIRVAGAGGINTNGNQRMD